MCAEGGRGAGVAGGRPWPGFYAVAGPRLDEGGGGGVWRGVWRGGEREGGGLLGTACPARVCRGPECQARAPSAEGVPAGAWAGAGAGAVEFEGAGWGSAPAPAPCHHRCGAGACKEMGEEGGGGGGKKACREMGKEGVSRNGLPRPSQPGPDVKAPAGVRLLRRPRLRPEAAGGAWRARRSGGAHGWRLRL